MPFDTSGVFNRVYKWVDEAAAGHKIRADDHDIEDNGFATALSLCLCNDGRSTVKQNITFSGKKITNLATPTNLADAANKQYVDNPDPWTTTRVITGADANGRLRFSSLTGTQGIEFKAADLSWLAKMAETSKTQHRLVLNNKVDGTGIDVAVIDDAGRINNAGVISHNSSWDGSAWRAISPGTGTLVTYSGGAFSVQSNDVATITNPYATFTPRTFFQVQNSAGSCFMTMTKTGTNKYNRISFMNGTENRWIIDAGNATPETGSRTGSDFYIYSYDNTGANVVAEMIINRETHKVTFNGELAATGLTSTDANMTVGPSTAGSGFTMARSITSGSTVIAGGTTKATGAYIELCGSTHATNAYDIILGTNGNYRYIFDQSANNHLWNNNTPTTVMTLAGVTGNLTVTGTMTADTSFISSATTCNLAATGAGIIYLRPNGVGSATGMTYVDTNGNLGICNGIAAAPGGVYAGRGLQSKAGYLGAYGGNWTNFYYNGSGVRLYVDATDLGQIAYSSDYRLKKDIQPLPSMWDKVKALRPVSYSQKAWNIFVNDDTPRWGFVAHELQERLLPSAASGRKDEENVVQNPDPWAVVAALTKALQEAMTRIEALEAAP